MIITLIALLITTCAFTIFNISLKVETINKVVMSVPKAIAELSIPIQSYDVDRPYFKEDNLLNNLTSYFKNNLVNITKDFDLEFYYYSSRTKEFCSSKCDGVEITFTTKVGWIYDYSKVIYFEIIEGNTYGK